jgi:hypothetical protein
MNRLLKSQSPSAIGMGAVSVDSMLISEILAPIPSIETADCSGGT